MTCSNGKKYFFGVKSLILYDQDTFVPKGIFEVIGSVEYSEEIEKLLLTGGHRKGAWAIEAGEPALSLTATLKEYPNFAFEMFANADITETTGEDATGFVDTIANQVGTSITHATTGIASVAAISGSEALLPFGRIVVVGTSDPTKVNVYLQGDVSSGVIPIVNELPLLAADLVIAGTGGTTDMTDYGIEFTGGSGAVAFVEDDVAYFDVRPTNSIYTKISVGSNDTVSKFGVLLVYPRTSEGRQSIVRFPNVGAAGMNFGASTREFSEFEEVMNPLLCTDEDTVYVEETIVYV